MVLGNIEKLSKVNFTRQNQPAVYLDIQCRDFQNVRFVFERDQEESLRVLMDTITRFAFTSSNETGFPAFRFREEFKVNGWDIYNPQEEYHRMGIPNDLWRLTEINSNYTFCNTYPPMFSVPKTVTDEELVVIKEFRSRDRIPVLSWVHPKNNCTITRCSQPLTAVAKRSKEDEKYIQSILEASPSCHKLVIVDARPKLNAVANQAKGGGYEAIKNYTNASIIFLDIANIHSMRESFNKLKELCLTTFDDPHWFSHLEDSKWLEHTGRILYGAVKVAETVDRNRTSVIVHCSDGWDRTSQLTSLAMICLDPYFRTITGFEVLIEKEWCSFGHKFAQRNGFCSNNVNDEQRCPAFLQYMDCVWQIMQQYPCAFEFTENLLIMILDYMQSCWFGTFLFDSQQLRDEANVKGLTVSIWSFINTKLNQIYNPLYAPERFQDVILPVPSIPYIKLWKSYYFRGNPLIKPKMDHERIYHILMEKHDSCVNHLAKLKAELESRTASKVKTLEAHTPN